MEDTLIIIFIAETDPDYVYQISSEVQRQFQKHLGMWRHSVMMTDNGIHRQWPHRNHLTTRRVLPGHDVTETNSRGRHGESHLEVEASFGLQLPYDVRQGPGNFLRPVGG